MSQRRQERMANEIKRGISRIIQGEIKDPRIDFSTVSVTRIEVNSDLSHAKAYFSILGDDAKQKECIAALNKAKGYIRMELSKSIQVRTFPELDFNLDKSIEHGMRITALLKELDADKQQNKDNEEQ